MNIAKIKVSQTGAWNWKWEFVFAGALFFGWERTEEEAMAAAISEMEDLK